MNTLCSAIAALALSSTIQGTVVAQTASIQETKDVVMAPPPSPLAKPELLGPGVTLQDQAKWPATLQYFVNGTFCTSTIIGSRVVITAAHCLVKGLNARVELGEGERYTLSCAHHPRFQSDDLTYDVAMCSSAEDFPTRFLYENLDLRSTRQRVGTSIFLIGYGCTAYPSNTEKSPPSGQLYGGPSSISSLPKHAGDHTKTSGTAGVCPGDSGGASYALSNTADPFGSRSVIAVNSSYVTGLVSFLMPLADAADFIKDWAEDYKLRICGVHAGAPNCKERFVAK